MRKLLNRHSLILSASVIFLAAFAMRLGAIKQYVTPDEPIWVLRSLNFSAALSQGDWAGTAQIGHPGVTTMWLGSLGIQLKHLADPMAAEQSAEWLRHVPTLTPENGEAFKHLGVFLTFARLPVILVNALGIVGIFLLARRLFGQTTALLAGLLLALDPFVAGLSGLLHVDGLLATFSTLSILALLNAVNRPSPQPLSLIGRGTMWFALSGLFAGLAFLSKSPALFLTPFAFLVVFVSVLAKRLSFRTALLGLVTFVIVHWALVILLYPAMWVDPIGTLSGITGLAAFYSANAVRPTFFDGQYALNHGLTFYPTALIFRLTPIITIGLIVAVVFLIRRTWRKSSNLQLPASNFQPSVSNLYLLNWLLIGAVLFIVFITPVAKKYDRYMLPALPLLILVAAWGLGQIPDVIKSSRVLPRPLSVGLGIIVLSIQALIILDGWPYLMLSYNGLLGGAAEAQNHFAVGWGEGMGAAANWINQQPDGLRSTVATAAIPSFAPIFSGRSTLLDDPGLVLSDYYVITLSERQLNPDFFAQLQARGSIVQTLRIGSVDGAWVFANESARQQANLLAQANAATDAIVTLIDLPVSRVYLGAAQLVVLPREVTPKQIEDTLNDLSTHYHRLWFTWSEAASPVVQDELRQWLAQTAEFESRTDFGSTQIEAYDLHPGQVGRLDPYAVQFGGDFALVGITPAHDTLKAGDDLPLTLRWQSLAPVNTPYSATLQLIDKRGDPWAVSGRPVLDENSFLPVDWPVSHIADQQFDLKVPPETPPGRYEIQVSSNLPDGQRLGLVSAAGIFSGTAPALASVQIDPIDRPRGLGRSIEYPFSHTWGAAIELLGFDDGPGVVINGDPWTVDLVWRGLRADLPRLRVVWQVRDQNEALVYETDMPLSTYSTSRWRAGEVIGAHYTLRYPVELQAADYHLSLGVTDADGHLLDGGMFTPFDVRLLYRQRQFELDGKPQHTLDVTFSDPAIRLIGADLPSRPLHPGDPLPVKLYWYAADTTETLYTVFVHLETLSGEVIAQIDSPPQGDGMKTAWWSPGQYIPDAYPLTIPPDTPPGAYRIVVGMYNPLDGVHLIDVATGEGAVTLNPPIIVR